MPTLARRPIRILFANCPRLDVQACAYLLLAQNKVQSVFEFEVYRLATKAGHEKSTDSLARLLHWWAGIRPRFVSSKLLPFRKIAERRYLARIDQLSVPALSDVITLATCAGLLGPVVAQHDDWLRRLPVSFGNSTLRPGPTVIVTETPLEGGYLSCVWDKFAVISLAEWSWQNVPTSALEYVLGSVQRSALRLSVNQRIGSHYPTRACTWDFCDHQPDAAMSTLVGYLCEACKNLILERASDSELHEIEFLLSQSWIGRVDDAGSIASHLKRAFGYDLAVTKGVSTSPYEKVRENLPQTVLTFVAGVISTFLVLWLKRLMGV